MKKSFGLMAILIAMAILAGIIGFTSMDDDQYQVFTDSNGELYLYVDKETCIEYYASSNKYNKGDISPRYNEDGTLKKNSKCLLDKK